MKLLPKLRDTSYYKTFKLSSDINVKCYCVKTLGKAPRVRGVVNRLLRISLLRSEKRNPNPYTIIPEGKSGATTPSSDTAPLGTCTSAGTTYALRTSPNTLTLGCDSKR